MKIAQKQYQKMAMDVWTTYYLLSTEKSINIAMIYLSSFEEKDPNKILFINEVVNYGILKYDKKKGFFEK